MHSGSFRNLDAESADGQGWLPSLQVPADHSGTRADCESLLVKWQCCVIRST